MRSVREGVPLLHSLLFTLINRIFTDSTHSPTSPKLFNYNKMFTKRSLILLPMETGANQMKAVTFCRDCCCVIGELRHKTVDRNHRSRSVIETARYLVRSIKSMTIPTNKLF